MVDYTKVELNVPNLSQINLHVGEDMSETDGDDGESDEHDTDFHQTEYVTGPHYPGPTCRT